MCQQSKNFSEVFHVEYLSPYVLSASQKDCWVVVIEPIFVIKVMAILKDHSQCQFQQLIDFTAIDYPQRSLRFELVYQLLSHALNQRIRIKIHLSEEDTIMSLFSIFDNAVWYEREVFDLFGISFKDSPDMRRLLTDYGFEGHPLRKDFHVVGYHQVAYHPDQRSVVKEPVHLEQPYRQFNFLSPWEGTPHLPGDEKAEWLPPQPESESDDE